MHTDFYALKTHVDERGIEHCFAIAAEGSETLQTIVDRVFDEGPEWGKTYIIIRRRD